VNEQSDVANCGACANACPFGLDSTATCTSATCGLTCAAGFADCDVDPTDGCEVEIATDVNDCGGCGAVCATPANAAPACADSTCGFTCNKGFADCDQDAANGCEVNTTNNPADCGSCGIACSVVDPNASAVCSSGTCGSVCNAGFTACNGVCVNVQSDLANCGSCGNSCTTSDLEATPVCSSGVCLGLCDTGWTSCNGVCVNEQSDVANCGACANACPFGPDSTATCTSATCGLTCAAGFADCDVDPTDGCEVDTTTDV
jgi:hypothetical protein